MILKKKPAEDDFLAKLVEDDDLEDEYLEEAEDDQEDSELGQNLEPKLSKDDLTEEIGEIDGFIEKARALKTDKAQSLRRKLRWLLKNGRI